MSNFQSFNFRDGSGRNISRKLIFLAKKSHKEEQKMEKVNFFCIDGNERILSWTKMKFDGDCEKVGFVSIGIISSRVNFDSENK